MSPDDEPLPDAQALYETAACGLLLTAADGTIRRANATFCGWIGRDADELVGRRRLQDLLTIGGRIFHETRWAPLLTMQGAVSEIKLDILHRDGRTVPLLMNALRREQRGQAWVEVAVMAAVDRDKYERELLVSRRQAEQLLDESRQQQQALSLAQARLRLALESAGLCVWGVDPHNGERHFDDKVAMLLGHPAPAPVPPQAFVAAIAPADRDAEAQAFALSLSSATPVQRWDFRLDGVDGRQRTISASGRAVRDEHGSLVQYVGVLQDITGMARERTQAEARARFAEQTIGIVSHDLRNPLSVIQMSGVLLGRGELNANQRQVLARIGLSTERAKRLIADLLDFTAARLGGGLKVVKRPIDLHAVVADAVEELQLMFPGHPLQHRSEGSGQAAADGDRLVQLVGNLVANAVAYGTPGQPIVVASQTAPGGFTLAVHNQGAPIPQDLLPLLFEPMTRGDGAVNPGRSVGLGLFIVREIVRAHGGEVAVSSSAASGTVVTARFAPPRPGDGPAG